MSYSILVILNCVFQYIELVLDYTRFEDKGIGNSKVILIACQI